MKYLLTAALLVLIASPASAHEYWLEPDSFFLKPGEKTSVHLFLGDGLIKDREEREYQPEKTVMFQLFGVSRVWDIKPSAVAGARPVSSFSGEKAGNYLLAMERNWSYITLEADKFEEYLITDGIDFISDERKKAGETGKEGKERYSRFIKSLIQVGDKQDATYRKNLGLKLELIPLANPYTKKAGDSIEFQVLFEGKPLANRTVFADNRESETQRMVSDRNGKFSFKIGKPGLWLARMVTMRRCKTACGGADWESFWGAYSFGVK